jgi:hypothetical protein
MFILEKIKDNNNITITEISKDKMLNYKETVEEAFNNILCNKERMYFHGEVDVHNILYGYGKSKNGNLLFWNNSEDTIIRFKDGKLGVTKEELLENEYIKKF